MEERTKKPVLYDPFSPPGATRVHVFTPANQIREPRLQPQAGSPGLASFSPAPAPPVTGPGKVPDKIELALHPPGARVENTFSMG
jgi:hypothetical protein